ncbi:MAG: glutathione S-transferase family protein [Archangium sp.]
MKLAFAPRTRAIRARWLLEELGAAYELITAEEFPTLIDGDLTLTGSPAVCLYLARGTALESTAYGEYVQWLLYAELTLEPLVVSGDPKPALDVVNEHLKGREFIAGTTFSAADIVMSSVLHRAYATKQLERYPVLVEYTHRHTARLSSRRAVSR